MKEFYYNSAVVAALIVLIGACVFMFCVALTPYRPVWILYPIGVLGLYAVVGAFVQGRDKE